MTNIQIPFVRPLLPTDEDMFSEIREVLISGQVTNYAARVRKFEREMQLFLDCDHVIAISNASSGLLLSLMATLTNPGRVILPAYTFVSTLNAVLGAGHEPVFCDINPHTFTMDPRHLSELVKTYDNVKAVIPVNVFGVPPNLRSISQSIKRREIKVLYDNAHGMGTTDQRGRRNSLTDIEIVSLHATKVFPVGEGGLAMTNNPQLAEKMRKLINHGLHPDLRRIEHGINAKMDEIRAIIGLRKLGTFAQEISDRRSSARFIRSAFSRFPELFSVQEIPEGVISNFQNLGILINDPRIQPGDLIEAFRKEGIQTRRYFDPLLTKLPSYQHIKLPVSEDIWNRLVSFPIHTNMDIACLTYIDQAIEKVVRSLR